MICNYELVAMMVLGLSAVSLLVNVINHFVWTRSWDVRSNLIDQVTAHLELLVKSLGDAKTRKERDS